MESSIDSAEAMKLLGIKQQTLYAYASRGLLRRVTAPGTNRSLYSREDVERLLTRKADRDAPLRADRPAPIPATAPGSLSSAITEISPDVLRYRGRDVRELAVHPGCLENVAEMLWTGVLPYEPVVWDYDEIPANLEAAIAALQRGEGQVPPLRVMAAASLVLGESAAAELKYGNTARLARRLVATYAGCLGYLKPKGRFVRPKEGESIANSALRALGVKPTRDVLAATNAVFIWCADHELSSPTYAARVIASTGAGLHACISGAVVAHSGNLFGGGCDRVEQFLLGAPSTVRLQELVSGVRSGERLPGFGHALYPDGDPRAKALLDIAEQLAPAKSLSDIRRLVDIARSEADLAPSIELGLVAVARALALPPRSASSLWAVARSVGWVAHVMEQRLTGGLIRPRARRPLP